MEVETDNLQKYYTYLKGAKADIPSTYESFQKTLSDEASAKQYYDYLKNNKFDAPDTYESFSETLGLKKKGISDYIYPTSETFSENSPENNGSIAKDEATTPTEVTATLEVPKNKSEFKKTQLSSQDETNFQKWMGGEPDSKDYDYRGFYESEKSSGDLKSTINDYVKEDPNYHFYSIGLDGKVLKSKEHETHNKTVEAESKLGNELYTDEQGVERTRQKPSVYDEGYSALTDATVKGTHASGEAVTAENYITAAPQAFNKRFGEAIRNVGEFINLPQNTMEYYINKIGGKNAKAITKYLEQSFKDLPIIGAFSKDNIDNLATAIEKAGNPKAIPENIAGSVLSTLGSVAFDIATVRSMPTLKLNALAKYDMARIPMFPTYLATMQGTTKAREGGGIKEVAKATGGGGLAGVTYEGMGITAGRFGEMVQKLAGGRVGKVFIENAVKEVVTGKALAKTSASALANSALFEGDSRIKGGEKWTGAITGFIFSAPEFKQDVTNIVKQSVAKRAYVSYLTTTDNAIRNISKMNLDPAKLRAKSDELWDEYEKRGTSVNTIGKLLKENAVDEEGIFKSEVEKIAKEQNDTELLDALSNYDKLQVKAFGQDADIDVISNEVKPRGLIEDMYKVLRHGNKANKAFKPIEDIVYQRIKDYEQNLTEGKPDAGKVETTGLRTKHEILEEKTIIDNMINVNAVTQSIIENPTAFLNEIKKDTRLSDTEKAKWTEKIRKTVNFADPRIDEAMPIYDKIAELKLSIQEAETLYPDENVRNEKVTIIEEQIKEQEKLASKTINRPLGAQPKYEMAGNSIEKDEALNLIKQAENVGDLEGLKIQNDATVEKALEDKFGEEAVAKKAEEAKKSETAPKEVKSTSEFPEGMTPSIEKTRSGDRIKITNEEGVVASRFNLKSVDVEGAQYWEGGSLATGKESEGKGIGQNVIKYAMENLPEGHEGLYFPEPTITNKTAVPHLFEKFGKIYDVTTNDKGDVFIKPKVEVKPEPKKLTKKQQAEVARAQAALDKASKPKKSANISPDSESGKILNTTPSDLTDHIAQFLLSGKTLSRADFLRFSNYGNNDIRDAGLSFFLNKEKGVSFDVLHESLASEFGRKNMEEITPDEILNAIDALKDVKGKINRGSIIAKFKERHKEVDWQDKEILSPEERAKIDLDNDIEIVKSTGEFTDLIKEAEGDKDIEDAIKAFQTELGSGEFDWNYIKEKIKTDPEFFVNNWLFDLKPEQIKKLNEILSSHGEQIEFSQRAAQPPVAEVKGEGDIVPGRIEAPPGENGGKKVQGSEEIKPKQNEKPINEPNPPIIKGEENQLSGSTETGKKPVIAEGEAKPITAGKSTKGTELNDAVSKYGWSAVKNPEGFWLQNKDGKPVVKVVVNTKKGTYKFMDMSGTKLMDGRGQIEKSAEKLLKDRYYAKEVKPSIEELKNTPQGKLIAGVGGKIAELQSRQAKADNYQRQIEAYEKNPSQKIKDNIIKLEKELEYAQSYFELNPEAKIETPVKETPKITDKELNDLFPDDIVSVKLKDGTTQDMSFRGWDKGKAIVTNRKVGQFPVEKSDIVGVVKKARPSEPSEPSVEETPTQGIKFKDKTYTNVDQVMDAIDKGDITFEESKKLREDVGNFEENLRKTAQDNSVNMDKKMGNSTKESEDRMLNELGKKKGEEGKVAIRFLPPDPIPLMNTILYKQLVKVRDAVANTIANTLHKGMKSQMDLLRWPSKSITNFWGGLGRTQADIHGKGGKPGKLAFTGTVKSFAPYEAKELRGKWLEMVHSDPEQLRRVLDVLDPDPDFAIEKLSYGDLSLAEKNLYFKMRDWNTWVHETNYAIGMLDTETYLKNKDVTGDSKYIARMYDKYEGETLLDPAIQEFINRGNSAITTKMMTDMFKAREETTEWKKEHAIRDPTYLTGKRVMQTIQNVAINDYQSLIIQEHPDFVLPLKKGESTPKGYTRLGSSYSWGQFRNKAVINHVVEDFTGFYYSNAVANDLYNSFKKVDRSNVNQFYKKLRTVYNPMVQLGNVTGNIFFASANGINPISFLGNAYEAINLSRKNPEAYKALLKTGLIGDVAFTGELKPISAIKSKEGGVLSKADEIATKSYVGADNIAKISAYLAFREQGMSHEASVRRAYDAFQNYSTVGKTWDLTSKIPLVGPTFAKFQADLQRILVNNITTTPLTLIGTLMLIKMGGILASTLSGETEEERKVREGRKGVAKIPIVNIPLSFKVGKSEVNVARYLSPLYNYNYADAGAQLSEISKFLPIQLSKVNRPILGETANLPAFADATWGWIGAVVFDRDYRGISIQNPNASVYHNANITTDERILNVMTYIARSQVPFFKGAQDMYAGIRGNLDYYGRKRDWKQTILNNVIKIQEFDKPELKVYVERNIDYLTNRYTALAQRMGDANSDFLKTIKNAEEKGLSVDAMARAYEVADKKRSGQLQKSMDEQVPVMKELERLTGVYSKWYPQDPSIQENYQNMQSGINQRFNVLNDIDLQKKYPSEYSILKKNDLLNKPIIPAYWQGRQLSEQERKTYSNIYWSEYVRNLNQMGLTTQEEMDDAKRRITNIIESTTRPTPEKTTTLQEMAADAASTARDIANGSIR
ncbi:MAG: hypothetical protein JJE45_00480 [Prolixibacteraceae bacterium]|nr:hypothetical protein [Prolixibacteraceae bacterium]